MFKKRRSYKVAGVKVNTGKKGITSVSTKSGWIKTNTSGKGTKVRIKPDRRTYRAKAPRTHVAQSGDQKKKGCGCLPFFALALLVVSAGAAFA